MVALVDLEVGCVQTGHLVLGGVSLRIAAGCVTALLGDSGAGKTMLARTVVGLLPPGFVVRRGKISFRGRDVTAQRERDRLRGRSIFYMPQNAAAALNPLLRIGRQLRENSCWSTSRLTELLQRLQFADTDRIMRAFPFTLSGGESQRCLVAMALAQEAEVLLLDEPTIGMDVPLQRHFLELLRGIQREYNLTCLLISHNLSLVRAVADRQYVIRHGRIVDNDSGQELSAGEQSRKEK